MSTMTTPGPGSPPASGEVPTMPVYRFTVDQYLALTEAGILSSDDRVELLDGWIVPKMTKNPPHVVAARYLFDILSRLTPAGWFVSKEDPVVIGGSVPEPDIAVIRGASRDYKDRHPGAEHVGLIVEVAASSLPRDRGKKLRDYAAAGVPLYWLVNLADSVMEVYSDPKREGASSAYDHLETYGPDAEVPVVLDGREVGRIAVRDILP
jgi:Uma2 family endonuclease